MSQTLRSNALRVGENVESNENQMVSRKGLATRSTQGTRRAVLGEIGNRVRSTTTHKPGAAQNVTAVARKPLARSKASSSIRQLAAPAAAKSAAAEPEPEPFSAAAEEARLKAYSSKRLVTEDIDADDEDNPQLVAEYITDIYLYLRLMEDKFQVAKDHLANSKITGKMREILIDWLVQVHLKFKLLHETLYLTVAIIDRYIQADDSVAPAQLQLVGVTAMWIASKYEEIYAPEVNDFVVIADKSFDQEQMRSTERRILNVLNFDLGRPLPLHFLRRNSKAGRVDNRQHTLAKYLMELSLQDYRLASCRVSELAAAALCLSLRVLPDEDTSEWTDTLAHYSYYEESELRSVMARLAELAVRASEKLDDTTGTAKRMAVARKYATKKFLCVSQLPELRTDDMYQLASETVAQQL